MPKNDNAFLTLVELYSAKKKHNNTKDSLSKSNQDIFKQVSSQLKSNKSSKKVELKQEEPSDAELFSLAMQGVDTTKEINIGVLDNDFFPFAKLSTNENKLKKHRELKNQDKKNNIKELSVVKTEARKNVEDNCQSSFHQTILTTTEMKEDLFKQAMSGVEPIKSKGRDVPLNKDKKTPNNLETHNKLLQDLIDGNVEFSLEYSGEFIQCHVRGLDPMVIEKLKAGSYSYEAHLDLHGQTTAQAYSSLIYFIQHAYQRGLRNIIIVTGRGLNSPNGISILRERIQTWLTKDPFKRVVLAFCTAQMYDGGTGALYVLLRKYKKNRHKITWDRPIDLDTLDG